MTHNTPKPMQDNNLSESQQPLSQHVAAFVRGAREFRLNFTTHYDSEALLESYDWGREWAHRLTFRRFEQY